MTQLGRFLFEAVVECGEEVELGKDLAVFEEVGQGLSVLLEK